MVTHYNSSTTFCVRSSSCRTDLSIHFQQGRPTTIEIVFLLTLTLSLSTFNYETDHRKCDIVLGGWHCGLRFFYTGTPALHVTQTQHSSMTCMLHRPELYFLHHRGDKYTTVAMGVVGCPLVMSSMNFSSVCVWAGASRGVLRTSEISCYLWLRICSCRRDWPKGRTTTFFGLDHDYCEAHSKSAVCLLLENAGVLDIEL